jgi:hypothetical protein
MDPRKPVLNGTWQKAHENACGFAIHHLPFLVGAASSSGLSEADIPAFADALGGTSLARIRMTALTQTTAPQDGHDPDSGQCGASRTGVFRTCVHC